MTTTKKLVIAVVALSLALVAFASVTLAWITAQSTVVTNTFTYGKVEITLDEADVDEYGVEIENAERVTENEYKLVPGSTYTKDPEVHVVKESEPCYVYVEVNNGLKDVIVDTTIEVQMANNGWVQIGSTNVWYYKESVDARKVQVDLPVFDSFTISGDADVKTSSANQITIKAYAVQSANLGTAEAAWAAISGTFTD